MDFKEIKGRKYYLFNTSDELKTMFPEVDVINNWRNGQEGEWVFTDDKYVCQILKKTRINVTNGKGAVCVRTVLGMFQVRNKKRKMIGSSGIAENIYRFAGVNPTLGDCSKKQILFAKYVATGIEPKAAYKIAFPSAKKEKYIAERTNSLLKQESVLEMVDKKIQEILDDEGVSPSYIIQRYKVIADVADSDSNRLRALESLSKISGLFNTESKKTEQLTIFKGFTEEQMEALSNGKKQELVAHAEKES
jgi:hypothetical protein